MMESDRVCRRGVLTPPCSSCQHMFASPCSFGSGRREQRITFTPPDFRLGASVVYSTCHRRRGQAGKRTPVGARTRARGCETIFGDGDGYIRSRSYTTGVQEEMTSCILVYLPVSHCPEYLTERTRLYVGVEVARWREHPGGLVMRPILAIALGSISHYVRLDPASSPDPNAPPTRTQMPLHPSSTQETRSSPA